ncbi:MAG: glucosamine-6-phosphate deaminase [Candidatus Brockarchaeota archaeon]|nr:glucosamine-6-phosphate deaminase [Candidatus Brockarchaeota archaeon]
MRVIITKDYDEMSIKAARIIAEQVRRKPNSVLGLAAGSTPLGTYKELIRMHREEGLDFSSVITFNLDEYYGLAPDHPQSYHYFMFENFFKHVNINPKNIHTPDGLAKDVKAFCEKYEEEIKKVGGIDLQLLGIGRDGHIAFNEPGSSLAGRTMLVALAEETIKDNARFFKSEEEVPRLAITMGCGTIMEARRILLLANGENKADAIAATVEGPVTSQVTASILQMHPDIIVIVDEAAASKLKRKEYYKYVNRVLEEAGFLNFRCH